MSNTFPRFDLASIATKQWSSVRTTLVLFSVAPILSACFTKDEAPYKPPEVEVSGMSLIDYDTNLAQVNITGKINLSDAKDITEIRFFASPQCAGEPIGSGLTRDFLEKGIPITVSSQTRSKIFLRSNTQDRCFHATDFIPDFGEPPHAVFEKALPASPTTVSTSPALYGKLSPVVTDVAFYSDSTCSTLIGQGSASEFETIGIQVSIGQNQENTIYSRTTEPFGRKSSCALFTRYIHRISGSGLPSWTSISPVPPTNATLNPVVRGEGGFNAQRVEVFGDPACSSLLASGTASEFSNPGLTLSVQENTVTPLYAISYDPNDVASRCTYLTTFVHDSIPPLPPTVHTIAPASPTRLTLYPRFTGNLPADGVEVRFFSEENCVHQRGVATKGEYESTGTLISVIKNFTTPVHAQTIDAAGNPSPCTHLTDYRHNVIAPDPPVFDRFSPVSPNNLSTTPLIFGGVAVRTVSVKLFDDNLCSNQVGAGTTEEFREDGIEITLAANTSKDIHAQAVDEEGNISDCAPLANYAHSNLPAPDPVFSTTSPISPSRFSTRPFVVGTAHPDITSVSLFSDNTCSTLLGSGTRINYITVGVPATLPQNTHSSIYARSSDIYGNESSCVFLTTYTHNNVPPFAPTFTDVTPDTPNNISFSPVIQGTAPQNPDSILPPDQIQFYNDSFCLSPLRIGSAADFTSGGITLDVVPNTFVPIYANARDRAGNRSSCAFLLDYAYDDLTPARPIMSSSNPRSPSYNRDTIIFGTFGPSQDFLPVEVVRIYDENTCTSTPLAEGTPEEWTGAGIPLTVYRNATTTLYAASYNAVGTSSECNHLINFFHNDLGPDNLRASEAPNGSIILRWSADTTAFPFPTYTVKRAFSAGGPYTVVRDNNPGTSYRDESVVSGQTYYYVVNATNNTGRSLDSNEISFGVTINTSDPPSNLLAIGGSNRIFLQWSGVNTALNYKVFRSIQAGGPYQEIASELPSTFFTDSQASNGGRYYYVVAGVNPYGTSAFSNEAAAAPNGAPLLPPSELKVEAQTCNILSWSTEPYYDEFVIYRGNGVQTAGEIATTVQNSYIDCGPYVGVNEYRVSTRWDGSESPTSDPVYVYYWSANVNVNVRNGDGELQVSWTSMGAQAAISILRSTSYTGPFTEVASGSFSGSRYTDTDVVNGTSYYYRIIPTFDLTNFDPMPGREIGRSSGTPRAAPPGATNLVVADSNRFPKLSWSPPSYHNSFDVERASSPGGPWTRITTTGATTYTDASPGATISYYRIRTNWGPDKLSPSNTVYFRNGYTQSLVATGSVSSISLTWPSISGATSYDILRSESKVGPFTILESAHPLENYSDNSVTLEKGYYYQIRANFIDTTKGPISNTVGATAGNPEVPTGLSVVDRTSGSVRLEWLAFPSTTYFSVYRAQSLGGPYTRLANVGGTVYTAPAPSPQSEFFFKITRSVRVGLDFVESDFSEVVSAVTVGQPAAPEGTPGDSEISLTWIPGGTPTSYTLQRSTNGVDFSTIVSGLSAPLHVDNTVTNGLLYFYKVISVYSHGGEESSSSEGITPGVIPAAPSGLTLTGNSDGTSIALVWDPTQETTGYQVYAATSSGGYLSTPVGTTVDPYFTVTSLTPGLTYYFVVTSSRGEVESSYSNEISAIPLASPAAPTVTPEVGGLLEVTVSWSAVSGATAYDLERSRDEGSTYETLVTGLGTTSYVDNTVLDGLKYRYRYLPSSSGIQMARSAASIDVIPGNQPLSPANLLAFSYAADTVSLQWISVPGVMSYRILRSNTAGGPYSFLDVVSHPGNMYEDPTATGGFDYFYVLQSVNAFGVQSPYSNEVGIKMSSAPTGVTASVGTNALEISWNSVVGASNYNLLRSTTSGGPYGLIRSATTSTNYTDSDVENGVTYYYVVTARFPDLSLSALSNEDSAQAVVEMDIEVPVALIDQGIASSGFETIAFESSKTRITPDDYDGTVTTRMELVATNQDSVDHTVNLIDSSDSVVGSLLVPANTTEFTRIDSVVTLNPAQDTYRLQLPQTSVNQDLRIRLARLLIHQVNASKTKVYIPLFSSELVDVIDPIAPAHSTQTGSFVIPNFASVYRKNIDQYSEMPEFNSFELDVIANTQNGAIGSVALRNRSNGGIVDKTEIVFQQTTPLLAASPFSHNVTHFSPVNEGQLFGISVKCQTGCSTGTVELHKAGLWIKLARLKKAEVIYRNHLGQDLYTTQNLTSGRTKIDTSRFSNPTIFFGASAHSVGDELFVNLSKTSNDDSGASGTFTGNELGFNSSSPTYLRSSSITVGSSDRFYSHASTIQGATLLDSHLAVQCSLD